MSWLPAPAGEIFGEGASEREAYGLLTVDVPAGRWTEALRTARDELGCTWFDWLSAVDEPGEGFAVCAHLVAVATPPRRLLLRTTVPHDAPVLATATGVYAGAAWHERETHEMFGVDFTGHPGLTPLLLPDTFEGHPLRKDFVLAARVAKAWPGAKEPGESGHGGPRRRQMLPPGVPDPNEWGPLKGTLPDAPAARPARGRPGAPAARPARRAGVPPDTEGAAPPARRPRRSRSAGEGSASQRAARPARPARPESPESPEGAGKPATDAGGQKETPAPAPRRTRPPRSADAPWNTPRPEGGGAEDREDGS
ncbi:hypothetical protein GCM10009716_26730 [Streptomyces sodiiphilus]|uniref:NADH:ubiquinone oxidoreductase 30kDa subunit domain-containing protein n=1 Tax=Streptomyces sodiiphilus TaxID=226217 RepID=A0ABN2PBH3_9ACTN